MKHYLYSILLKPLKVKNYFGKITSTNMKASILKTGICIIATAIFINKASFAGNPVLPTETSYMFTVINGEKAGEVNWQPVKNVTVLRYELEKSNDGINFTYVTAVSGTISSIKNYSVQDRNLTEGMNYYRIKMITDSGTDIYSNTVSFDKKDTEAPIQILPAVVSDELYIWLPSNTQVSNTLITDVSGRKVNRNFAINNFTNAASVKLGRLPAGFYNITVTTNTGIAANFRFSKK
jgi:hypothetical protein